MIKKTIRIYDDSTNLKLTCIAKEKDISVNDLINIILDRAVINNNINDFLTDIDNDVVKLINSHNELINSIYKQTESINRYIEINEKLMR